MSTIGAALFMCSYVCGDFQTFSELIEAASRGDQRGVDQFEDELMANTECAEGDESLYSFALGDVHESPELVFSFGKAVDCETGTNIVTN